MSIITLALTLLLASLSPGTRIDEGAAARPRCAALAAVPVCRDTPNGVVVGLTEAAVTVAAEEATVAERTWAATFGAPPTPYAVVLDQATTVEALRATGALRVLPWISVAARRQVMEQGVRDAVARQAPAGQADALMASALARAMPQIEASLAKSTQPGVMAHELGHLWYIQAYWTDVAQAADTYGSAAPDWLDEAAAVLMEREALTEGRRTAFHRVWAETPQADAVSGLMAEIHPAFASGASASALTEGQPAVSGPRVMTMSGEEFQRRTGTDINAAGAFYTRVRAMLDFIEARTGDHQAIVRLTMHLRAGGTVGNWLAQDPAGRQLGGTVPAADAAFKAWADEATATAS